MRLSTGFDDPWIAGRMHLRPVSHAVDLISGGFIPLEADSAAEGLTVSHECAQGAVQLYETELDPRSQCRRSSVWPFHKDRDANVEFSVVRRREIRW